jgi:uncharacterized protein
VTPARHTQVVELELNVCSNMRGPRWKLRPAFLVLVVLMEQPSQAGPVEDSPMVEHRKLSGITYAAIALVVIGALNWGLVGLFNFNLVDAIFGHMSVLSRIVYVVVALGGLYMIADAFRLREEPRRAIRAAT